jgi:hypothetical protein
MTISFVYSTHTLSQSCNRASPSKLAARIATIALLHRFVQGQSNKKVVVPPDLSIDFLKSIRRKYIKNLQ